MDIPLVQKKKKKQYPYFFPTSLIKLGIMSVLSFGLYETYWFYKNWKYLKKEHDLIISPFWRGVFAFFYCDQLFSKIKNYVIDEKEEKSFNYNIIILFYIALFAARFLPSPYRFITIFTFIPLLFVQIIINKINIKHNITDINKKFTRSNIIIILIGLSLWTVILYDCAVPRRIISIPDINTNYKCLKPIKDYLKKIPKDFKKLISK